MAASGMSTDPLIRQASSRSIPPERELIASGEDAPLLGIHDLAPIREPQGVVQNSDEFRDLPVYSNIWRIRRDILRSIEDPYSLEQLRAPRLNTAVVRPLLESYYELHDLSIVYCLLVNRVQFLREQSYQAHYQSVNTSRALLCEVLALKLLRQFDEDTSGRKGLLLLANILIAGFEPFQNAPSDVRKGRKSSLHNSKLFHWSHAHRTGSERQMTALEIAIISGSKQFLSSPACQKVVDAIYVGRIVYTPTSFIDIIPDHYKWSGITLYNPRKSPLLNQYRLVVPRTRNAIELVQFLVLLGLFFWVMETRKPDHFTRPEAIFCVYTLGWILDQFASMLEHGWHVYTQNLWSFLDVAFSFIYLVYFVVRVHSLTFENFSGAAEPALDILAMGAPVLLPRLAFNVFSENLVFVSLRDMMGKFLMLTLLAVWTFAGFFLSMLWLSRGDHTPLTISKWMIWVWFGLDGTGIGRSAEFHWLFGPILMITFAILGNTLFLTILVSTLSTTFSNIHKNSVAEVQFRRAVLTFEGVKSDVIFAYQPPTNILALLILLPLKIIASPRWFHKINVALVRTVNAPILLLISAYERITLWPHLKDNDPSTAGGVRNDKFAKRSFLWDTNHFARWRVHGDIQAVFCAPPPSDIPGEYHDHPEDEEVEFERHEHNERDDVEATATSAGARAHSLSSESSSSTIPEAHEEQAATDQQDERRGRPPLGRHSLSSASRRKRKVSVWSSDGLEARMAGLLQEHEENGVSGNANGTIGSNQEVLDRLESLEKVVHRINGMLTRICETMEDGGTSGAGDR